jgi:serine/threonine-protein kinase
MAPEQARGNPADMDERSDIFGLGAVLYEIVSGQRPYGKVHDPDAILARACANQVVPIDDVTSEMGVSRQIKIIIAKATAPDPKDRYQTATELRDAIHAFLRGGLHLPSRAYAPGQIIVQEGDPGNEAYMIASGRCRAYRKVEGGQETLSTMGPGEVFGEMALLLEEPRSASVEAVDKVTVLVLDKHTMSEGLGVDGWTGSLVRALAQRFKKLEQQVRASGIKRS